MSLRHHLPTLVLLTLPASALAFPQWTSLEEARLLPDPSQTTHSLGHDLALDGDTVAVGAVEGAPGGAGGVRVYFETAGQWTIQADLQASDASNGDSFGWATDLDGDTLIVGAPTKYGPGGEAAAGAAYVYVRNGSTWSEQAKLLPSDLTDQILFAYSVAIDGDTAVVGAPQATTQSFGGMGAVYVFTRTGSTWTQTARLAGSVAWYGVRNGWDVALQGNRLLIGAPAWADSNGNAMGGFFEFTRSGSVWTETDSFFNPTPEGGQPWFGGTLALDGNRAVVGAYNSNQSGLHSGTAWVLVRKAGGWQIETHLTGNGIDDQDYFGTSVAIRGQWVAVGAPYHSNSQAAGSGTVKLYESVGSGWVERMDLVGSATTNGDRLGDAVSIDGSHVAMGATLADTPSNGFAGEAYVLDILPPVTAIYCTAQVNSQGCTPAIGSTGTPSLTSAAPFLVQASLVINNKPGILYYGFAPDAVPFQGGTRCVANPITRLSPQNSGGTPPPAADCSGSFSFDFNARIQSGVDASLVVGEDIYCQWWYRDPMSPSLTGLSDALRFRIQP